jgi:hypothetical protein
VSKDAKVPSLLKDEEEANKTRLILEFFFRKEFKG